MNTEELEALIKQQLHVFYASRIKRIQGLKLKEVLKKKNPYLFRATGIAKYSEIVEDIIRAFISSSDETMFGKYFFEPIAKMATRGIKAPSSGIDIAIDEGARYTAISMKSGVHWGNRDQLAMQDENFRAIQRRLYETHQQFDPVVGHGYGRKNGLTKNYRDSSGQAFWTEVTGDSDFYLKLIRLMKDEPAKHRDEYKLAWDLALNRFNGEFYNEFCFHEKERDGAIDWEKLTRLSSEYAPKKKGQKQL
jgi:hypothetical protein